MNEDIKTVIIGSFRKDFASIVELKRSLQGEGIVVLSPRGDSVKNPDEEFALLNSDPVQNHQLLQNSIFAKMRMSSFVVLANFDGYIGKAALMEFGYALASGLDIFTVEEVEDPNLRPYCQPLSVIFPKLYVEA